MRDASYEILDMLDQYGKDTDGALMNGEGPEVLYAFSADVYKRQPFPLSYKNFINKT